jgi:hypothetical protein
MKCTIRWICGFVRLRWKLFLHFTRWSTRVSLEQCTSHRPSICNLFQDIVYCKYIAWESSNDIRLFETWFYFGTYLPAASNGVYWKHIWITSEKWFTSLIGLHTNTKIEKNYEILHATMNSLECQQSGTSLQHPTGSVLVMGLVAL